MLPGVDRSSAEKNVIFACGLEESKPLHGMFQGRRKRRQAHRTRHACKWVLLCCCFFFVLRYCSNIKAVSRWHMALGAKALGTLFMGLSTFTWTTAHLQLKINPGIFVHCRDRRGCTWAALSMDHHPARRLMLGLLARLSGFRSSGSMVRDLFVFRSWRANSRSSDSRQSDDGPGKPAQN